jgi:nuclear pore complex protein Nup160
LPFQGKHTVKHGKINMEYSAATAVEVTSLGLDDTLFAVTVCLDHRMRIWNLNDGQIVYTGDILNVERSPQEVGKWCIDPAQTNLIRIVGHTRGSRICATYSPVGAGEFKLWALRTKGGHVVTVDDLFPNISLIPVTPSSSDVWTLADFVLANPRKDAIGLWTLWKNNMTYKVQKLELDRENMSRCWNENWESVYANVAPVIPQASGPCDPVDVTEKWLEIIMQPGRFTKATLSTALSLYERGLGGSKEPTIRSRGLANSICAVLGATASLQRGSTGGMEYEQFRSASEDQWRQFYRLLIELDKQRGEAVGLSYDPDSDLAWVVCTDLVSVVRECGGLERLYYNLSSPEEDQVQQAALISSALNFVEGFPDNLLQMCSATLRLELFEESSKTDLERISYFSDKSAFWRGITDEECAQIVETLGQNFSTVTDELYGEVLQLAAPASSPKGRKTRHFVSDFGKKLIMKAAQDYVDIHWRVCLSQLILLVHMEFEFDVEEDALHNRVDIGTVFRQLVNVLRRMEFLRWLSKTEIQEKARDNSMSITALEANLSNTHLTTADGEALSTSITDLVADLCSPNGDIDIPPFLVQCHLLKLERADLALDVSPFCDQNPFSVYLQGRVFLALKDFESAATNFRKAAIGMGKKDSMTFVSKHKLLIINRLRECQG